MSKVDKYRCVPLYVSIKTVTFVIIINIWSSVIISHYFSLAIPSKRLLLGTINVGGLSRCVRTVQRSGKRV